MSDIQTPTLRQRDMMVVEDLFIRDGFVLRFPDAQTAFNDRTFGEFFQNELRIDIDEPKWSEQGTSKGKRLRFFLRSVDSLIAIKTLKALWEHREAFRRRHRIAEPIEDAHNRLLEVLAHLGDTTQPAKDLAGVKPARRVRYDVIHDALMKLSNKPPQERGYLFETFLQKLFTAFDLEPQRPFRLTGEQIDGSFLLDGDTYLVEAKWHNERTGAKDLRDFHGKFDERAPWGRGLFVSYSGFTDEGLTAFGRGKKVICMDGLDLSDALRREIPLPDVLKRKARRAVEYGLVHARVSDLFP